MPVYGDQFKTWKNDNKIFIETGSFLGDGVQKALDAGYEKVFTFEIVKENNEKCKERFSGNENINCILGDSVKLLPDIMKGIDSPCTFWLDSHFHSGDCDMYPLFKELDIIKNHPVKNHTILIDDIRLLKDGENQMPWTKQEVESKVLEINPNYTVIYADGFCKDDIMVAYIK